VRHVPQDLGGHPDRLRWNARYGSGFVPSFAAHPLAVQAAEAGLPDGPMLDLASGPSGSALLVAAAGRQVVAVDASDVALVLLGEEARRRRLAARISRVQADLAVWRPPPASYALVLSTGYWDRRLFPAAALAVVIGGLLGWEAFTTAARHARPGLPAAWCLEPGEPASLLPAGFEILAQRDLPGNQAGAKRQLLARRTTEPAP
jgi:hypothetical protein